VTTPCAVDGCPNEAKRGGYCWAHVRRRQRGQALSTEIRQRPQSAFERVTACIHAYVDADSDEEFARARDNLRKACAAYSQQATSELTREAMAKLKTAGVHVGRPPKVTREVAITVVAREGSMAKAALLLGVSWWTIRRALRREQGRGNGEE
jgi:molybdenum-dependent DNA-binding transcriptional regulator ModE